MKIDWLTPKDYQRKEELLQAIENMLKNYENKNDNIKFSINKNRYDKYV